VINANSLLDMERVALMKDTGLKMMSILAIIITEKINKSSYLDVLLLKPIFSTPKLRTE